MKLLRRVFFVFVTGALFSQGAVLTVAAQGGAALVGDLTVLEASIPRRLVGYGIVTGLGGTGDRSLGGAFGSSGATPTVQGVQNLLRNFGAEIPTSQLRLRNAAAVLVTAEISPFLRPGGRFDIEVSSLGDATSLRGGVLFMAYLTTGVGEAMVASAQGRVVISEGSTGRFRERSGTSGRVIEGGVMEVALAVPQVSAQPKLILYHPNLTVAQRITQAINDQMGAGSAVLEDPGSIQLTPTGAAADNVYEFISVVNALNITNEMRRIVINSQDGTVVAGGSLRVGAAAVTHSGITLTIADSAAAGGQGATAPGLFRTDQGATVQEIAEGLHLTGARPSEIAAIFVALRDVGALTAEIIIR